MKGNIYILILGGFIPIQDVVSAKADSGYFGSECLLKRS